MAHEIQIGSFKVGADHRPFLIAGPCVIESEQLVLETAARIAEIAKSLGMPYIFKSSFDKANRTSITSYRGPGIEKGLAVLKQVKDQLGLPVLTDVHTEVVNVKKGQFLSPQEMGNAVKKVEEAGNRRIILTERGSSFGYNNLVVDMRSFPVLRCFGYPVVFDATHSVQLPGGGGTKSSGQREFVEPLACAAAGAGVDGFFMEVHPNPDEALSDGPNMVPLHQLQALLERVMRICDASEPRR